MFDLLTLAFDMPPEMGIFFGAVVGLGIFIWYVLPQWLKDIITEIWNNKKDK